MVCVVLWLRLLSVRCAHGDVDGFRGPTSPLVLEAGLRRASGLYGCLHGGGLTQGAGNRAGLGAAASWPTMPVVVRTEETLAPWAEVSQSA